MDRTGTIIDAQATFSNRRYSARLQTALQLTVGCDKKMRGILTDFWMEITASPEEREKNMAAEKNARIYELRTRLRERNGNYHTTLNEPAGCFLYMQAARALSQEIGSPLHLVIPFKGMENTSSPSFHCIISQTSSNADIEQLVRQMRIAESSSFMEYLGTDAGNRWLEENNMTQKQVASLLEPRFA